MYLQDDYKVTKELTLNLGLRWDPWLPPIDENQTLVGFQAGFQSKIAPGAPLGLQFVGDHGVSESVFHSNWKDLAPRVGFAYNVAGKGSTVLRGAYGLFYGFPEGLLYQRTDAMQPIDLYLNISAPGGANPGGTWDNTYNNYPGGDPFPRAHVPPSQFATYQVPAPPGFGRRAAIRAHRVALHAGYNLTVDQKLPAGFSGTVAYVGNVAKHVMSSRQFNPAVCAPGAPCSNLNNSTCTACTTGNENARRLFPGLGAVELADAYEYANFNSLQATLTRRVALGFKVLANFVYAKVMDNASGGMEGSAGPNNPFNFSAAYGPADFNQKFRTNVSVNYLEPNLHASNGFVHELINGYEANMIWQGAEASLRPGVSPAAQIALRAVGCGQRLCRSGLGCERGASQWRRLPQTMGSTPRALPAAAYQHFRQRSTQQPLTGPGYQEVDASLFKNFFAQERVHGQFRAECFNLFNHPNFANPADALQ